MSDAGYPLQKRYFLWALQHLGIFSSRQTVSLARSASQRLFIHPWQVR